VGILKILKEEINKIVNPYEHETEIQREERHRKEDRKHELELAKIRSTKKLIRENHTDKGGDSFMNDWKKF
jgi:hypothetical protein